MAEGITWVKALQTYFTNNDDGFGKKIEMAEFKALTEQDKMDFHKMLQDIGIESTPPVVKQ